MLKVVVEDDNSFGLIRSDKRRLVKDLTLVLKVNYFNWAMNVRIVFIAISFAAWAHELWRIDDLYLEVEWAFGLASDVEDLETRCAVDEIYEAITDLFVDLRAL